jgi:putative salt-induced outer membrane protein YdiY
MTGKVAIAIVLMLAASVPAATAAQTAEQPTCPCPPPEPPPPLWTGSLGFSYLATAGNSESETIGLAAEWLRRPTPWGLELRASANRAEADGERTAERTFAAARGKRVLAERSELFGGLSFERDELAGLSSRALAEAGGVWYALRGEVHRLDLDLGLTWTREELVDGGELDFLGALAGLVYQWTIGPTATFRERLVVLPNFEDSDDWRLRSETSLDAALATAWALRLGFVATRDNAPPPGFERDDTATSVSLVWKR